MAFFIALPIFCIIDSLFHTYGVLCLITSVIALQRNYGFTNGHIPKLSKIAPYYPCTS